MTYDLAASRLVKVISRLPLWQSLTFKNGRKSAIVLYAILLWIEAVEFGFVESGDGDEVDELLVTQFFNHEPLGVDLGSVPEKDVRPWLHKITRPMIEQGVRKQINFWSENKNLGAHLVFTIVRRIKGKTLAVVGVFFGISNVIFLQMVDFVRPTYFYQGCCR